MSEICMSYDFLSRLYHIVRGLRPLIWFVIMWSVRHRSRTPPKKLLPTSVTQSVHWNCTTT